MNTNEPPIPHHSLVLKVGESEAGARVDVWLKEHVPHLSRKLAQRLCETGRVRCDQRPMKKADVVVAGATITVELDLDARALPAPELNLEVVVELPELLVLNKPAGVPCAALLGANQGTLAGALLQRFPEVRGVGFGERDPGLVHRLDTYTSGLIVAARNQASFTRLRAALVEQQWDKRYLALVLAGTLPNEGICELPLGPDPKNRRRVRVDARHGKPSCSSFSVERRGTRFDLVEVRAKSAYRHQVRVHLAALGAPLLGDTIYGGPELGLSPRHALHAHYICIPTAGLDPVSCPLPADLLGLLDEAG